MGFPSKPSILLKKMLMAINFVAPITGGKNIRQGLL